ncbi:MAG: LD-carboxypeptidase [Oscillospiraceae bacterium]|nr:LD-carboxypeptidase [Oscillospiraceae bacterium]
MKMQKIPAALLIASALIMCSCGDTAPVSQDIPEAAEAPAVTVTEKSVVTETEKPSVTEAEESMVTETEVQLLTEGEDTECKVEFRNYSGKNSSMFLSAGDKIAVISPSALPSRAQTDAVISGLKEWGYEPAEGKYVCAESRTTEDILEDLEWALNDPDIKAIFCVRGGYGASEVADRLSDDLIRSSGKLIIGYSDITVYHSAWTSNGIPSVHACMSGAFGDFPESCFKAEENILKGEIPVYTCKSSSYCRQGEAKGILIGGNLSTFCSVLGSDYDCTKTDQPYILFLEDVGEDIRHIHRYLTILKHSGVLDNAAGIVFGEWTELPAEMSDYDGSSRGGQFRSVADMISRQFLQGTDIPVAFGFPAGHGDINYPLIMGETAELSVDTESFRLTCCDNE